jgi:hypothetical protein
VKFAGELKFPDIDHPGVPVHFVIEGTQAELIVEGESLGRWSLFDVRARRLIASAFEIDLDGTEVTFVAADPIDFAYRGVEHMAQTWATMKSKRIATRSISVRKSRRGTKPSRIEDLRAAMESNLESAGPQLIPGEPAMPSSEQATSATEGAEPERALEGSFGSDWDQRDQAGAIPLVGGSEPASDTEDVEPASPGEEAAPLVESASSAIEESEAPVSAKSKEELNLEAEKRALAEERARLEAERRAAEEREANLIEAYRLEVERLEAEREELRRQAAEAAERSAADRATAEQAAKEAADRAAAEEKARADEEAAARAQLEREAAEREERERQAKEREAAVQAELERRVAEREIREREAAEREAAERAQEEAAAEAEATEEEEEAPQRAAAFDASAFRRGVVDLDDLEEEAEEEPPPPPPPPPPAPAPVSEPEPALAGAPREKSGGGLMGAVKAAFRSGPKDHEHRFVEAPGGIGITRYVCEECGYVSISV